MVILSWFENRPPEEIPNENLWEDPKGLEEWWERVKRRKEYASGRTSSGSGSQDYSNIDDEIVDNELATQFKQ